MTQPQRRCTLLSRVQLRISLSADHVTVLFKDRVLYLSRLSDALSLKRWTAL